MTAQSRPMADAKGDETAIIEDGAECSWATFHERANRALNGLRDLGFADGEGAAVVMGNAHELLEIYAACNASAHRYVPVNWHFSADEVAYILDNSEATTVFTDVANLELVQKAASLVDRVERIICTGDAPPETVSYEEILAGADASEPDHQARGSSMLYTSGTTGRPKGVVSSARILGEPMQTLVDAQAGYERVLRLPSDGRVLMNAPGYHGGPALFGIVPFFLGNAIVLRQRFDAAEALRDIDDHGITTGYFVPTHFVRFLRLPDEVKAAFEGSSLQAIYHTAAPCPPAIKRQMIEWWGPVLFETYAATDAGVGTLIDSEEWLDHPGSVGRAGVSNEIVIVDDGGNELGPNEPGTIYFRSRLGVSYGYLGDEEKTAKAHLDDVTVTVGDVGYLDEEGYLYLSDRKIDMIISGGVNIYPAEIEAHLITHPAVADVAVFGVPDDEFGEQVKAAVLLADGHEPGDEVAAELTAYCRDGLAGFKVPRSFDFVDEFPRTETGKLQKRRLRDPYWEGRDRSI